MIALKALGIYREREFSPGKVGPDAAILDAVLAELERHGFEVSAIEPARFGSQSGPRPDLVLAMCQGAQALRHLSEIEQAGAVAINSALSIRNCYRDLLNAGLARAGVPIPHGKLIDTSSPAEVASLPWAQISMPLYVKRGDLHALEAGDVRRVETLEELRSTLSTFARREVGQVYVQQEVAGTVVKFYGVSGGEYFSALPERDELPEAIHRELAQAAATAASAIGLDAWGGDAVLDSSGGFTIIDFNDWPSFSRVQQHAARAIARRAMWLLQRARLNTSRPALP
jgi:glutathione synthase/RimK-type ligase-like ATP-grasp enzyme